MKFNFLMGMSILIAPMAAFSAYEDNTARFGIFKNKNISITDFIPGGGSVIPAIPTATPTAISFEDSLSCYFDGPCIGFDEYQQLFFLNFTNTFEILATPGDFSASGNIAKVETVGNGNNFYILMENGDLFYITLANIVNGYSLQSSKLVSSGIVDIISGGHSSGKTIVVFDGSKYFIYSPSYAEIIGGQSDYPIDTLVETSFPSQLKSLNIYDNGSFLETTSGDWYISGWHGNFLGMNNGGSSIIPWTIQPNIINLNKMTGYWASFYLNETGDVYASGYISEQSGLYNNMPNHPGTYINWYGYGTYGQVGNGFTDIAQTQDSIYAINGNNVYFTGATNEYAEDWTIKNIPENAIRFNNNILITDNGIYSVFHGLEKLNTDQVSVPPEP